ncbi:MAG: hypothetical protein U1E14_02195 [Geminicoccaceae bacterium]
MNPEEAIRQAWKRGGTIDVSGFAYGPSETHGGFMDKAPAYYRLLAGLAASLGARTIVEAGTHYGGSALSMATGMRLGGGRGPLLITSDIVDLNRERLKAEPEIVKLVGDSSTPAMLDLTATLLGSRPVDILYIDGRKDRAFVLGVAAGLTARVPVRWLVIDDIATRSTVTDLWRELVEAFGPRAANAAQVVPSSRSAGYGMGFVDLAEDGAAILARLAADIERAVATFDFDKVFPHVRHMARPAELRMLYGLARQRYTGMGAIIDAGCFLGGSTLAMARGLDDRPDRGRFRRRIHAYDKFQNSTPAHRRILGDACPPDGSFFDLFAANVDPLATYINVYNGDFRHMRWPAERPIELCFVDVAKSPGLNKAIYTRFAPAWVPGETLYIQQDTVHLEAPWIQVAMGELLDSFVIEAVEPPSLVLRYVKPLPADSLARVANDDFTAAERVERVMRLHGALEHAEGKATMLLLAARLAHAGGDQATADGLLERCVAEYGDLPDPHFQKRIVRVRGLLHPAPAADAEAEEPAEG